MESESDISKKVIVLKEDKASIEKLQTLLDILKDDSANEILKERISKKYSKF